MSQAYSGILQGRSSNILGLAFLRIKVFYNAKPGRTLKRKVNTHKKRYIKITMKGGFNYITSPSTQTWSEPPLKHFVGFV